MIYVQASLRIHFEKYSCTKFYLFTNWWTGELS